MVPAKEPALVKDSALSAVSLAEIVYLVEKNRLPESADHDLKSGSARYGLSRTEVSDMPDRIVAATALYLGVPVITRDGRIRASNLQTVW